MLARLYDIDERSKALTSKFNIGILCADAKGPRLAPASGVPVVVGLQVRCDPTLRFVRDLLAQRYVGDVLAITMAMISPGLPERAQSRMWESTTAGGVSALTIRTIHSLEALCMCA